ncbi:MAG: M1 family metallopeptidase, partial [Planctomycetota bacterium]
MQTRRSANVGYHPAVLLALGMIFGAAGRSPAQRSPEPTSVSDEPAIVGCGKAEAMRARFVAEQMEPAQGGVAEAMGETDVLHNDLTIEISNLNTGSNTCTITGQNRMTIKSKTDGLTAFTFRLRSQYTITSAVVNDLTPFPVPVSVTTLSPTTRSVTLDPAFGMDAEFTLTIAYTGSSVSLGFGSIQVTTHSGTAVVATLSEPYYAYTWWPAKDGDAGVPGDNSDKATLDLTVTAPNDFIVAANGLLQGVVPLSGGRNQYHWSSQYPIVTYLVSFAATNYITWTKNYVHPGGTMPVEFFIYPENNNASYRAGWEKVTDMMTTFRPLFGEYPFINEKYGIYNFPFGGGMEHQTITGQSGYSEGLTSHELSHQWWGDAVTCRTWSDIWLNEGFATYAECLWEEYKTGVDNPSAYFSAILAHKPSAVGDSVYVYPPQTGDVGRIFSSTYSYLKGAWVLHQLRHVVGDATFFQILADYRAAYEGSAATTDEFVAVASATYGQDLTWFFDEWVYQIGAPTYRYGWDSVNVGGQEYLHVKIEQRQTASYPNVFTMPVDVVATIAGSPQTLAVWNNARSQRFVLPVSAAASALQFDPQQWILRPTPTSAMLVIGDMDGDNDVDAADFTLFDNCFTGSGGQASPGCVSGDFDGDGDIDCTDWIGFRTAWTAGGFPPTLDACGTAPGVVAWDSADTSPDRTTRSLRFRVEGKPNGSSEDAIRVTMVDLQNPVPLNAPCCPPQNFGSFEWATCTAGGETNGCARWVGKPGTFYEAQGPPLSGPYRAARLQCSPFYWDWVTETASGPISVVGAEIMPSSEYSVRAYASSCAGHEYDVPDCAGAGPAVTMYTRRSGDVETGYNPPGTGTQPDANDVTALVNKFTKLAGAPLNFRSQLQPNLPELNTDVSASDIVAVVDAYKGFAYPYGGPCP